MENNSEFLLRGFWPVDGFRVFGFERMEEDRSLARFTVRADMELVRRYGIRLQDLPSLCRRHLEAQAMMDGEKRAFTLGEEAMRGMRAAEEAAREAQAQKKKPHRPAGSNLGAAWRGPRPPGEGVKK